VNKKKLLLQLSEKPFLFSFSDLIRIVKAFRFPHRNTEGSHWIFKHPRIPELLNIQNYKGRAKPYQIKQFLTLVNKYELQMEDES